MYGPSVMSALPPGCRRSDLARLPHIEAAGEEPDASGLHLYIERIDVGDDFFALEGAVVAVGVVYCN